MAVKLDSTNLPIVKINTELERIIPDEPKTTAWMQILDSETSYNKLSDTVYDYNGYIGIEYRGSTSLMFYPKKSFGVETRDEHGENLNISVLDMPRENDWVLYASYGDKTLLRNVLTYKLSNDIGLYAPRTQHVELVLNGRLLGTYVFMEKIKRDRSRVDVSRVDGDDNAGDSLTGGYIIKIDKTEGEYYGWYSEYGTVDKENYQNYYHYVYPKPDKISEQQIAYIQNFMHEFETALRADDFENLETGYMKYIDVESFICYMIMNELTKNMDGYRLSTYMYKDRDSQGGKLHMGPVWDYNLAMGNYSWFDAYSTEDWALDFG
jgi:spore coat protein CotH